MRFPHFIKMLEYWSEFKILTGIDSKTNPINEILWNSRKILVGKKTCFYQNWHDAGIIKISDILNQNQDFLVPFTIYYGLVNAIPKNWKACLKNPTPNVTHDTTVNTLRTSSIYSSLLNIIFVPPTAETKILRHGFTENTTQKVYLMPFAVTNEIKIIMFQYKAIHNVLPTRGTLYRDAIAESPMCNLCNAEEKTLHHLLKNCTLTVDFWILFQDWWYQKTNETITLSISHILHNTIHTYLTTTTHRGFSGPMKHNQRNNRTQQLKLLRISTGRRQTSWLFTSAASKLNQGLAGTNSSGQSGS